MAISAQEVKALREKTGAGMMDCKKALIETGGDAEKAVDFLRKKGLSKARDKAGRDTKEGVIHSYIHPGSRVGVLVEVNCETDFVAKTDDFQNLVKDIGMHIAAAAPRWVRSEEVPSEVVGKEAEIFRAQMVDSGKPDNVIDKIVEGKLKKFYSENCLMEQGFVKDPDKTVQLLVEEVIARLGENIQIARFVRFGLGEG